MKLRARHLAVAVGALNLAGMLATLLLVSFVEQASDLLNLITFAGFVIACAIVGALIASKRPANPIGWILSAVAFFGVVAGIVTNYIEANPTPIGSIGSLADWIGSFIWTLAFAPIIFVLGLFPTGRALGRRWVPVLWVTGAGIICFLVAYAFTPGPMENSIDPVLNPYGIESLHAELRVLSGVGGGLIVSSVVLSVISLGLRWRRSTGVERQQLKWFAYAGLIILGVLGGQIAIFSIVPETDTLVDISNALFSLTVLAIPLTIGVAMLRYRLYDIDRIISRTLAYGALTAVLGGGYLLAVLGLQSVLPLPEDSPLIVAVSTLAVVAAFGPLRTRIQHFVDRRFNRSRYDAERTIAEFGGRLRSEVELDALTLDLVAVVENTVQPAHVSVWLRSERVPERDGRAIE